MNLELDPMLEGALNEAARRRNVAAEVLALEVLHERFLASTSPIQPRDDWERRLLGLAKDCGVSLSNEALGREEMYE